MSGTDIKPTLRVYNTLTRAKEDFVPSEPGQVKMYVCGPTVYDFVHVGNFRGAIFFNLVRNWLEHLGYKVTFVYNYTDVDDKIIDRAQREGVNSSEISNKFILEFEKDLKSLGLRPHSHNPKVTEYIEPIVQIIQKLIERGHAYVASDGEVFYPVRKFATYGRLSHKNIDDLQSGARVEVDSKKQDPLDFSLWKPAKPGEPKWKSPWCDGRPGWHIECSAMSSALLGDTIDIHGGGSDLIFPHHENEIAQSEGATGKPFVRYWMHNNMLTFGDKKMSKSLGNIRKARDFVQEYNAEIFKFLILTSHYRSLLDFSEDAVHRAISGLARIYSALALAESHLAVASSGSGQIAKTFSDLCEAQQAEFNRALSDDFNTPEAFAAIFNVIRGFNAVVKPGQKLNADSMALVKYFKEWMLTQGRLMALMQEPPEDFLRKLDDMLLVKLNLARSQVDQWVAERSQARGQKDFKKSDELRDILKNKGILVQDTPSGAVWEVDKS